MMTSSNGNIFRVTGPLCGEFTCHRHKRLVTQSWGRWFETPSCLLWRHCNDKNMCYYHNKSKLSEALFPTFNTKYYTYDVYMAIGPTYHWGLTVDVPQFCGKLLSRSWSFHIDAKILIYRGSCNYYSLDTHKKQSIDNIFNSVHLFWTSEILSSQQWAGEFGLIETPGAILITTSIHNSLVIIKNITNKYVYLCNRKHLAGTFYLENIYGLIFHSTIESLKMNISELIEAEWRLYESVKWSSFVQIMACRLIGTKPLSESMLDCCQLNPCEHISGKILSKYNHFHWRKCTKKCRLRNGVHFVSASMC